MKRTLDILRFVFISPEFGMSLLVLLVYYLKPSWLGIIGEQFKTNEEVWKFLPTLPIIFTGFVIKIGAKIRAPLESKSNKILYEWPQYNMIKDRVLASIFICISCSFGAISIWLFTKKLSSHTVGAIYILSVGISGLTALCMVLALPTLKELLEKHE